MKYTEKKLIFTRFSFLIIILVVVLIFSTVLITGYVSSRALYNETARSNARHLETVSRLVDSNINQIGNSTMLFISRNVPESSSLVINDEMKTRLALDIQPLLEANPYIDSIYLYLGSSQQVFYYTNASIDVMPFKDFFDTKTYTAFLKKNEYTYLSGVRAIPVSNYTTTGDATQKNVDIVSIFKRLPLRDQTKDVLVININAAYFSNILSISNMPASSIFLVSDAQGESIIPYSSSPKHANLDASVYKMLFEKALANNELRKDFTFDIGKERFIVNTYKESSGRIFSLLVAEKSLAISSTKVNMVIFWVALFMLILGILLSILISSTISQPILNIINRLKESTHDDTDAEIAQKKPLVTYPLIEQIGEQIDDIVNKTKSQEAILDDYFRLYKERVLISILEGSRAFDELPQKNVVKDRDFSAYIVILCSLQNNLTDQPFGDEIVLPFISLVENKLCAIGRTEIATIMPGKIAIILSADDTSSVEKIATALQETLQHKPQQAIVLFALGKLYNKSENIPYSYREAVTTMENANFERDNVLLSGEDLPADQSIAAIAKTQEKIIADLNTQNLEKAVLDTTAMYDHMMAAGFNLRRVRKQFLFLLYNISLELSSLVSKQKDSIFSEPNFDMLEHLEKPEQIRDWTISVLRKLLSAEEGAPTINNRELINKVITYIDDHYQEDISLYIIAEYVFFSPQYLGKLFRETTGISFTSYLIKIRMEAASNLLLTTKLPVATVASKVGYGNVQSFGRIFKSYFNCTPGEYRKRTAVKDL